MATIETKTGTPLSIKLPIIIVGIIGIFAILYIGRSIFVPLVFATLLAILMNPLVNFLCNKGLNRILAITVVVLASIGLFVALVWFISWQATMFSDTFSNMEGKFKELYQQIVDWVSQSFKLQPEQVNAWFNKTRTQLSEGAGNMVGQTLSVVGGLLAFTLLLPIYVFLILYYKTLLLEFIAQLFAHEKHAVVVEVLSETKTLIQSYLVGLLMDMAIVATLNSAGLLIIGVQYAILIGLLGALLNLIPYIGGIVAVSIPLLIALATEDDPSRAVFSILILYSVVQLLDNNFIVPRIVASKVKINALASIVIVLIGAALWGIPGMFLSIPLIAILKVIFDRVEPLKPFGFLLGDNMPPVTKQIFKIGRRRKKAS